MRAVASAALGLALTFLAGRVHAAPPDVIEVVRGFYAVLMQKMRQGLALGPRGRYEHLSPAVHDTFDVGFMTRLAVGPGWASLSSTQQQRVTEAFERYVAATYADRFDRYSGERLEVIGERAFGSGLIVETRIVGADGKVVAIGFVMRRGVEGWRASDVYLDGTISELAARRSEFSLILRDRGIDGLITALNQKINLLGRQRTPPERRTARPCVSRRRHEPRERDPICIFRPAKPIAGQCPSARPKLRPQGVTKPQIEWS